MKLSEYAQKNNVTWRTAYRWYQEGKIPGAHKTPGGSIVVAEDNEHKNDIPGKISSMLESLILLEERQIWNIKQIDFSSSV